MRIKLLFLILCSPVFIKAQESDYDYKGTFFFENYKNYKYPYQFKVEKDTLFVCDAASSYFRKAFIFKDTILTDSAGKHLWELADGNLVNVANGEYTLYRVVNSYMIEQCRMPFRFFFMYDRYWMGHIGPYYYDGQCTISPSALQYPPLKQKMQRMAILVYQAELVNAE